MIALIVNRVFFKTLPRSVKTSFMISLVKIALIANRVFFKTLPRSVKTSFMIFSKDSIDSEIGSF